MIQASAPLSVTPACGPARPAADLDPDLFRDAMARLAGGVAVAACWEGDRPRGLLVSSITALSAEPPRVLFCVRKTAASSPALLRSRTCSLAILAEDDQQEAERFSRPERSDERFDPSRWALDPAAPPRHRAPLVGLEGAISHRIDAGTHSIFILDIHAANSRADRPLVYFDRAFQGIRALSNPAAN